VLLALLAKMELQVFLAVPDLSVLLVQLAQSGQLADLVQMVSREDLALKEKLELQVAPVVLAEMANLVPQVDNLDQLDLPDLLDNPVPPEALARTDSQVDQEPQVKMDFQADQVSQVNKFPIHLLNSFPFSLHV
jgi:hypothetical protein